MSQTALSTLPSGMGSSPIRIMIVDDSVVIRGVLSKWFSSTEGMQVVAKHRTGLAAVNDILISKPDVVILDLEMPEMDGLTALPKILAAKPDTIVIMASTLTQRNAEISLAALELGAKDYIPKPSGNAGITTSAEFKNELISKVDALTRALRRRRSLRCGPAPQTAARPTVKRSLDSANGVVTLRPFNRLTPNILVIGSSTGGPHALIDFFNGVGSAISTVPTLITQHMPATFTAILASHIARATNRDAKEAEDGEPIKAGVIYVAPGGKHMLITGVKRESRISLSDAPPVNFCKPAVDPMFDSAASIYGNSCLAVVLTGMGADGARGAVRIADSGGNVIAQDEATSVVWGMPRAAAMAGACAAVLPLDQIGRKVAAILGGRFI